MSAAIIADNTTIKINGGGIINASSSGTPATTLFTTGANEYAILSIRGRITASNAGKGRLRINAITILENENVGSSYLGNSYNDILTIYVPQNSTVDLTGGSFFDPATITVSGSYVKFVNTP